MGMDFKRKLPIPMDVKAQYPVSEEAAKRKQITDSLLEAIFSGRSEKRVLIIGPCSADNEDSVLEYCLRLAKLQARVEEKLLLVPRVFTNKPRTTGAGYKGMLHQPNPNEKPDPFKGILATRRLHTRVLTEAGLSSADEMLYPANFRYLSDLVSYAAVGARSTENQEHRMVASGLSIPVGMKNPVRGDLDVTVNSVTAAQSAQSFIYRGWDVATTGNPLAHAILRGGVGKDGCYEPNYGCASLCGLYEMMCTAGVMNPSVIVDLNHANSGKDYLKQPEICFDVLDSCKKNADIARFVKGFMIESYLLDGSQPISENEEYGKSITDPCLGWEKSERLVLEIAERI